MWKLAIGFGLIGVAAAARKSQSRLGTVICLGLIALGLTSLAWAMFSS
jgi:hypothetical protein